MKNTHRWPTLQNFINRHAIPESAVFGGAAILVGLASGLGVWVFKQLIALMHWVAFGQLGGWWAAGGGWTLALVPIVGGLLVGLLKQFFIGEERHHGVTGIIEAVALAGGRLRYPRIPIKTIGAAVSIGFGAAVGPEDPSVQIGANLGSMAGQLLHLSDERMRALVAAGAAGGVAAAFNAPIAGVFFALEIILVEFNSSTLGSVLLAAVVSAVFTQAVEGPHPAFQIPTYAFNSVWELPFYVGLGFLAGPLAALYVQIVYYLHDLFHALHRLPIWLKSVLAGAVVGVVGLFLPQVLGVGYESIEQVLYGHELVLGTLLWLTLAKILLNPVSLAGGFQGGTFAPSLFIGAMFGGAYGLLMAQWFPGVPLTPPAFALVGMAALLAGTAHAPLTAILLLFEMTNDYRIILPLMLAVSLSVFASRRLHPDSIYALGLARKGIRLERGRDVEVLDTLKVAEVMDTTPATLQETDTLLHASAIMLQRHQHGLAVLNPQNELVGILTLQDIERLQATMPDLSSNAIAGTACTRALLVAHPDETLSAALRRISVRDIGGLPVVPRTAPRQLLGMLHRSEVVRAYDAALTRRAELRHRVQQVRLGALSYDVHITEMTVSVGAACAGKRVQEVNWPRDCVIATVRRGAKTLLPHGDTVLQAGDVLVVAVLDEARAIVRALCQTE